MTRAGKGGRKLTRHEAAARAREGKSERDDAVTCNLAPDLLPLWSRLRGQFRGTPQQRLDAFVHYAGEHGAEIERAIADEAEETLRRELDRADSFAFGALAEVPEADDVTDLDDAPIVYWGEVAYLDAPASATLRGVPRLAA